jgi:type I restriction enzyme S subunit
MNWQQTSLGEVIDIFDHKRVPLNSSQRAARRGPYPYYGAQGVIDHVDGFLFDGRYLLIPEDGENLNSRKLPIAFFADGKFWVNNHAHIIRAKPDLADDVFLKQWLNGLDIRPYVTGAAQPKLSQANLKRMQIRLPPLPEQRGIASILGAYDELIEINRRRITLLEEMATRIFEEWFFHFPGHEHHSEGKLPQGWKLGTANELIEFEPKMNIARDGRKPFIPMDSLSTNSSLIGQIEWREGNSGAKFRNWDTLFARITPCLENGKTGLVRDLPNEGVGFGSTEFIVMRGREAGPAFCYLLARQDAFREHARRSMSGATGRQRARTESLRSFQLPVPPKSTLDHFEQRAWPLLELSGVLGRANASLALSRDLLLPRLISGELSVTATERKLEAVA